MWNFDKNIFSMSQHQSNQNFIMPIKCHSIPSQLSFSSKYESKLFCFLYIIRIAKHSSSNTLHCVSNEPTRKSKSPRKQQSEPRHIK